MVAKDCSYCGREGLLIYPVRYAIACPAGAAQAPALNGNFKIDGAPADVATAKYTLRAVRTGYLYTYDEKRNLVKAYVVMPEGHLWNFPFDEPPPDPKSKPYQCTSPVEAALSMCVDVLHSEARPAGIFWIGWSNSAWTPALIKKLKSDDEWRRKHMREIDIPWMLTGMRDAHVGEFQKYHKSVAHFSMTVKDMQKAFGFSNTPISHEMRRLNKADRFVRAFAMQAPIKKGYIVALDDPVGMTNDLSELTVPTEHSGFNVELYRARIIEEILQNAEDAVRKKAARDFEFDVAQRKEDDQNPIADSVSYSDMKEIFSVIQAGGPGKLAKRKAEEKKTYGDSLAAQRRAAEDRAWAELTTIDAKPVLDAGRRAAFPTLYSAAIKSFEKDGVALARVHAEWLTSSQLARWMDGVHDQDDLASGFAYRESLAQCLGKGVATVQCDKQLQEWLKSDDVANTNNLYARAMLFNQAAIISAAAPQIKGIDIKPKYILSIYKQGAERLKKGQQFRLVDHLIFTTANIMVKALGQGSSTVMKNLVLLNLSMLSKTVILASEHSSEKIRDWIIAEATKSGVQMETGLLKTRADAHSLARTIPPRSKADLSICAYEFDATQLEQDGRIKPSVIKNIRIPGYTTTANLLGSSADFNIGSVAVILQFVAFGFALRDYKVSDSFESDTTFMKLGIAISNLSGSLLELAGGVMEKSPTHPLSTAIKNHWAKGPGAGKKILLLGKRVGALAGVATAALDIFLGFKALREGNRLLATLYATNAVLGVSLAIAGYFSLAIFWPLFIVAFALSIIIALVKNSALKKWFSHCFFSVGFSKETGYATLDEELSALQSAMGT